MRLSLLKSHMSNCLVRHLILNIVGTIDCFYPKTRIHGPGLNHIIRHLLKSFVVSLYHTILLWSVGHQKLMLKTMFKEKILGLVHILPPLFVHICQIERLEYFSINFLKTRNESKTLDLYLRKYTHVCLEKSSMKVSTFMALEKEGVGNDMRSL